MTRRSRRCGEPHRSPSPGRWRRVALWLVGWIPFLRRRLLGPTPPLFPPADGPDDAGVREPRRPSPLAGAGAVALPEPGR